MRAWLEYVAYRTVAAVIAMLPRRGMIWCARRMGMGYYAVDRRGRRIATENLERVFPDRTRKERAQLLRNSYRLQATAVLETLWARSIDPERAAEYMDGTEAWMRAMEQITANRGVLIATGHYGSWELASIATGALGSPKSTLIARELPNLRIDRHMKKLRERTGNKLAYRQNALMACLRAVKRGEIAGSVIDMNVLPDQGGVFADFLGTPALTSPAIPVLAVRTGAPLYFIVCEPIGHGHRYRLRVEEIVVERTGDRDADVARVTLELNRALERAILRYPDPWIWNYKRWKWRPAEMNGAFPKYSTWIHDHW